MRDPDNTVVLDVMGADSGPEPIIRGGLEAVRYFGDPFHIVFIGNREELKSILARIPDKPSGYSIEHAETEVPMTMSATDGVRRRDSSIAVGLRMVKRREAIAFVSPGNTGAVMATALLTLGRIHGVSRPAITALFPTSTKRPTVVLDVGANSDCKPLHLSQYAVMGSVYASIICDKEAPRVGLLSIGEERSKGNELIFSTQELLKNSSINFIGNIEGRDILSGTVDVAITDGFTGNILLKFAESVKPLLEKALRRQIETNIFSRVGTFLMLPFMRRMKGTFDYSEYGGAPLLGVNGIVIICHGSSNARAISRAVIIAKDMAVQRITDRIYDDLVTNHFGKHDALKSKSPYSGNRIVRSTGSSH